MRHLKNSNGLKRSEELFRGLYENMSSGVAIYEPLNGGEDFVFKDINRASERIDGVKKADIIGKKVTDIFPAVIEMGLFEVFKRVNKTSIAEFHPLSFYKDNRFMCLERKLCI